jgi:hypothetical protein
VECGAKFSRLILVAEIFFSPLVDAFRACVVFVLFLSVPIRVFGVK